MGLKLIHRSTTTVLFLGTFLLLVLAACQSESTQGVSPDSEVVTETLSLPAATNTVTAATPTAAPPTETLLPPADLRIYRIVPEESEARFYIDELLFGNPKTVIGRTREISGEIQLDMEVPGATQVSIIEINALDLTTDDSFRNRALRSQILESSTEAYQFIFFEPVSIQELPGQVGLGEPVEISMTGNLTIKDITSQVTFELVVTPVSEDEVTGSGSAVVRRETFSLDIPKVTGVAEVSQEVRLEIDFFARAE